MTTRVRATWLLSLVLGIGCSGRAGEPAPPPSPETGAPAVAIAPNPGREVLATRLEVDLATRRARAAVTVGPSDRPGCSLEARGLAVSAASAGSGPLATRQEPGWLHVALPASARPETVVIEYGLGAAPPPPGALTGDVTLTWPYFCGALFPCHSAPSDGSTFELALTGVPAGQAAVFPSVVPEEAPAYMLAWAVGDYRRRDLGPTAAGTLVSVWAAPGDEARALQGAARLREVFEWYEQTYGSYPFGRHVGSVVVDWGPGGAFGGMEHHPFWHVSSLSAESEEVHAHEASHGWFGNGVRLRCWEDFVLSEGLASYLAARALEAVGGPAAGERLWAGYRVRLRRASGAPGHAVAWPASCGQVDVLSGLFSDVPYMEGAFFLRAVERRVGREALDRALAELYRSFRGRAAGMNDLLDAIRAQTGFDPRACAEAWLRRDPLPADEACAP